MDQRSDNINVSIDRIDDQHKFGLSVDVVILGYDLESVKVLVIDSDMIPFKDQPSLLGDLVFPGERLSAAAARILKKHTGLEHITLEQLGAFDGPDRHPVDRVISIGYFSVVNIDDCHLKPTPSGHARWVDLDDLEDMAFDHRLILDDGVNRVRKNIDQTMTTFDVLPEEFTMSELQKFQEIILGKELDKRNFRKRVINMGLITSTGRFQKNVSHRPAELFRLNANL